ncbi:MAG TPA: CPBP family intramembrane metalloprotease [Methylothermaceae bacterium]|nr:CPBP family intramembrane metalloprotease [Methylothermaceae bacterium]
MFTIGFRTPWVRLLGLLSLPLLYLMASAILGTVIAYLIYPFSQALAFDSLVVRSTQLVMILGTIVIIYLFRLTLKDLGAFGLDGLHIFRAFGSGFGMGFLIIAPVLWLQFAFDIRHLNGSMAEMSHSVAIKIPAFFIIALLVAVLEEWVFRGVLLGLLWRYASIPFGIIINAIYFAGLHFLRGEWPVDTQVTLLRGLEMAVIAFSQWFSRAQWDVMLALISVGILLGAVRWRLNCLGYCVGIHASWIIIIKTTRVISDLTKDSPWLFLIGDFDGVNGIGTALWLMVCTGILLVWGRTP